MNEVLRLQIQSQLDNAQSYDIIQLPPELDFPLIISKPCTVMGHETIIDTTEEDVDYIIRVLADDVTLSDIILKNKPDKNGIYAKTSNSSLERISINNCDVGIFIEKSSEVDLIELKTFYSKTGIRIKDCKNLELNACSAYGNSMGLDIIGTSPIAGSVDSYQGFGLNVEETDISPLIDGEEYEFKIDGMVFSFKATNDMTYNDIIAAINNIIGFNPTYNAEFFNGDIIIKTQASTLKIETVSSMLSLINSLLAPLLSPINNKTYSFIRFGLNVEETDISPITRGTVYTFGLDGNEIQFFSSETDGTTYGELANVINSALLNKVKFNNIIPGDTSLTNFGLKINGLLDSSPLIRDVEYEIEVEKEKFNFLFNKLFDEHGIEIILPITYQDFIDEINKLSEFTSKFEFLFLNKNILIKSKNNYFCEFKNNDIYITKNAPSIILTDGTRFSRLFITLGKLPQSSNFVTESYQFFGLNILSETNLVNSNYFITINNIEYKFAIPANTTYNQLVDILNANTSFKSKYIASIENNDIKVLTNLTSISIERPKPNLFDILNTTIKEAVIGLEINRTDRSHHIDIIGSLFYENGIGIRLTNVNNITLTGETKIFSNTNIGLWQLPNSYNVKFRGEIYDNTNYGIRNTDKSGGTHDIDAMDSWWGDRSGPGMFGAGEGDKISANILFKPTRQNGTVPDLSYPKTRQFILSALGYPIVKVELTDQQIQECIDKAIFKFMQYRTPEREQRYITTHSGSGMVKLPLDLPKEEIIEVTYSPNADIFAQLSGSGESFYLTFYMQNTGGTFLSDFYVAMAYKETMEQTLGIWPSYELLSGKDVDGSNCDYIRLSPKPSTSLKLGILFSRPMTEDEADQQEWIHKYSLAWAKEILGRVRSKYGSVPGPSGEMQLDGATLLSEAQQEKEKLETEIINISEPLGFIVG